MTTRRPALALMLTVALGGCAVWRHQQTMVSVTPVRMPASAPAALDDGLYDDAVRAIETRNYAAALERLQAARERNAGDVRVLNAFGVVYDKLGRFDLSARYYAQAQALDPRSTIVRQNLAYSALLQNAQRGEAPAAVAIAEPRLAPAEGGRLVVVAPAMVRLEVARSPATTSTQRLTNLTGHPLAVIDASGMAVAEPVRLRLARLGWSAPRFSRSRGPSRARSSIIYAPQTYAVARALARTLLGKFQMTACDDGCQGVRLILGTDAASWKLRGRTGAIRRTA